MPDPIRRPFDITSLLEPSHEETSRHEDAYAPPRTRAGDSMPQGGDDDRRDSGGPTPGPEVAIPPVSQSGSAPVAPAEDAINPAHYRKHPSGIECIEVTRHMNFNVGNAIKYLWRYMDKNDPIENLQKAQWYIDDEIRRLQGQR